MKEHVKPNESKSVRTSTLLINFPFQTQIQQTKISRLICGFHQVRTY